MKKLLPVTMVLAMFASVSMADDLDGFVKTYAEAQKAAKAAGKPMYLHFTTTWCGWCRKIEKDCYATPEGKKALEGFVPATLDCTVERGKTAEGEVKINLEMMNKFGGSGYPFLVILTPDGDLLNSWAGYKPLKEFTEELARTQETYKKYKEFQEYSAKADKAGYEYNAKALAMFSKMMKWDAAAECAATIRKLDAKNEKGDGAMAAYVLFHAASAAKKADEAKAALADVKKLDPANEKGYLEKAMWDAAVAQFMDKKREEGLAILAELEGAAKKLEEPQRVYGTLIMGYRKMGKLDEAVKLMEKAIAAEPKDSPNIEPMKKYLENMKKEQQAGKEKAEKPATEKADAPK